MTSPKSKSENNPQHLRFLAVSGRPHNAPISHLTTSHSLPETATRLLDAFLTGSHPQDVVETLSALRQYRDEDPASPTHGCLRWYAEDPGIVDTNAAFFVCTPLTGIWLGFRDRLAPDEQSALKTIFQAVLPWFRRMADSPSLHYPNKCISDAAMLLTAGHILHDDGVLAEGRAFCRRYFDFYQRRGTGWGEDHSPVYTHVICQMTLLIMALERHGALHKAAQSLTDAILDWVAFHDGFDAVPSIRGYNFEAHIRRAYPISALIGPRTRTPESFLDLLRETAGYDFVPEVQFVPRQRRWRTFDDHFSTSYIDARGRLGTLSEYPLMPNGYMHDNWGLGWQSKPCAFILGERDYGILEWATEDDQGVPRQHEAGADGIQDWASRHLFKRVGFHPDVLLVSHQEKGAAIILREIHSLHSPTRCLTDRWRVTPGTAILRVDGRIVSPGDTLAPGRWITLDNGKGVLALRPLSVQGCSPASKDPNPQLCATPRHAEPGLRIERTDRGLYLAAPIFADSVGTMTERLLFSGWCVVLLDDVSEADDLSIEETFREDGEIPRTYGERIRTVQLQTPRTTLRIERDMLTRQTRRWTNGAFSGT